jgi:hypothetical protein
VLQYPGSLVAREIAVVADVSAGVHCELSSSGCNRIAEVNGTLASNYIISRFGNY